MRFKYLALSITTLSISFSLCAEDFSPSGAALGGAAYSRSLGLENDVLGNPAMMTLGPGRVGAALSYTNWMPAYGPDRIGNLRLAYNSGKFAAGLAAGYGISPAYDLVSDSGVNTGNFSPAELSVRLGLSWRIIDRLALGVGFRYSSEKLAPNATVSTMGFSLFTSYIGDVVNASVGLQDLGPKIKSSTGASYSLASSVLASASVKALDTNSCGLNIDACARYYFSKALGAAAGAEFSFKDMVFARLGYNFASDNAPLASFASAGLGISLFGATLDLSYLFASPTISGTLLAGLSYRF